jgi:hypothetical protein
LQLQVLQLHAVIDLLDLLGNGQVNGRSIWRPGKTSSSFESREVEQKLEHARIFRLQYSLNHHASHAFARHRAKLGRVMQTVVMPDLRQDAGQAIGPVARAKYPPWRVMPRMTTSPDDSSVMACTRNAQVKSK